MRQQTVKTPCIGVCSTGIGDRVCRGCKRFAHEVISWNHYSNEQKLLVEERLARFLSQCTRNKLQVVNVGLLESQLSAWRISCPQQRDAYCRAYALLKCGASQIANPISCGLLIAPEFCQLPLEQLRRLIDEAFYTLSDAHYERYISASEIV